MLLQPFVSKGQSIFNCDGLNDNKLAVRWTVFPILDIYDGSAVVLGLEHKLFKNLSLGYDAGAYFTEFNGMHHVKGIILRSELKYYLNKEGISNGFYTSLAFFYKHQSYDDHDSIKAKPLYRKYYSIEKDVSCLTLKMGFQDITHFRLLIDFYGGIGIRYKRSSNTLTTYENSNIKSNSDYGINVIRNQATEQLTLNVELGVRIGFSVIK